jgi:hypothetical protein
MAYYIRVLSPADQPVEYSVVGSHLTANHPKAVLSIEDGSSDEWRQLLLRHPDGSEIALIERHFSDSDLLSEEIEEFIEEIGGCQPTSSVEWLRTYLRRVRTIYSLQILSGVESNCGWDILAEVKSCVWRHAGGIIQADGEGFTNEDGYHILWQFSDSVSGDWWMGVLQQGRWVHFKMNLGDREQRQAYWNGDIPPRTQLR